MQKTFCDCCKQEIMTRVFNLELYDHIIDTSKSYVFKDSSGLTSFSIMKTSLDLCIHCYNEIASDVFKKFAELKNTKK